MEFHDHDQKESETEKPKPSGYAVGEAELISKVLGIRFLEVPKKTYSDKLTRNLTGKVRQAMETVFSQDSEASFDPKTKTVMVFGENYPDNWEGVKMPILSKGLNQASLHETMHALHQQLASIYFEGDKREYDELSIIRWLWIEGVAEYGALTTHQSIHQEFVSKLEENGVEDAKVDKLTEKMNRIKNRFYNTVSKKECLALLDTIDGNEFAPGNSSDHIKESKLNRIRKNWHEIIYALGLQYINYRIESGESIKDIMSRPPMGIGEFRSAIS